MSGPPLNDVEWKRSVDRRLATLETMVEVRKALEASRRRLVARSLAFGGLVVAVIALLVRLITGA